MRRSFKMQKPFHPNVFPRQNAHNHSFEHQKTTKEPEFRTLNKEHRYKQVSKSTRFMRGSKNLKTIEECSETNRSPLLSVQNRFDNERIADQKTHMVKLPSISNYQSKAGRYSAIVNSTTSAQSNKTTLSNKENSDPSEVWLKKISSENKSKLHVGNHLKKKKSGTIVKNRISTESSVLDETDYFCCKSREKLSCEPLKDCLLDILNNSQARKGISIQEEMNKLNFFTKRGQNLRKNLINIQSGIIGIPKKSKFKDECHSSIENISINEIRTSNKTYVQENSSLKKSQKPKKKSVAVMLSKDHTSLREISRRIN